MGIISISQKKNYLVQFVFYALLYLFIFILICIPYFSFQIGDKNALRNILLYHLTQGVFIGSGFEPGVTNILKTIQGGKLYLKTVKCWKKSSWHNPVTEIWHSVSAIRYSVCNLTLKSGMHISESDIKGFSLFFNVSDNMCSLPGEWYSSG